METNRPILMIEGPKFAGYDFSPTTTKVATPPEWVSPAKEAFMVNGHRVVLPNKRQSDNGEEEREEGHLSHTANTAKSVWDCSIILSKYLEALSERKPGFWTGKRVLELGAGQGIASLSAAALGAERVIITDVKSAVPALSQGVTLNGFSAPQVQVTALDWTDRKQAIGHIWNNLLATPVSQHNQEQQTQQQQQHKNTPRSWKLDYILASDVIWVDYLIPALVDTMNDLLQSSKERKDSVFEEMDNCNDHRKPQQQQHSIDLSVSNCSTSTSPSSASPVVLLAYQFRSTRSDKLLFDSLDQLGLRRRKLCLSFDSNDEHEDAYVDDVYLDSKFRRPNLAIWKIWKN
ncbi:hypothetical protein BGX27_004215 [Mortierella sp. AM989]|nr:hypothetical protein BGX27_004215 [Mortierella sp. AM989]